MFFAMEKDTKQGFPVLAHYLDAYASSAKFPEANPI